MNKNIFNPGDPVYVKSCGGRIKGDGGWFDLIGHCCEVSHTFISASGDSLIYVWDPEKKVCWAYAPGDLEILR